MQERTACRIRGQPGGAGGAAEEGPPGQADWRPLRNGAKPAETEPPGTGRGAGAPALTPDPELPGTKGQGGGQGHLSDKTRT